MKRTLLLTSILYFLFLGVVWSQTASSNSNGKSLTALNSSRTFQTPKIKVYPNPATHYIKLSRVRNVSKIKVLTLIGSLVVPGFLFSTISFSNFLLNWYSIWLLWCTVL